MVDFMFFSGHAPEKEFLEKIKAIPGISQGKLFAEKIIFRTEREKVLSQRRYTN